MIKAYEAKVGYFYREAGDDEIFLVGNPDGVEYYIRAWYCSTHINGYVYDKHIHMHTKLQEWPYDAWYYEIIHFLFSNDESYFANNF